MKTFRRLWAEKLEIPRSEMPQVHHRDHFDLAAHLNSLGVAVTGEDADPEQLKAIQGEFNRNKVAAIAKEIERGEVRKPIIISSDDCVVDGNHRWLAHKKLGRTVGALRVHAPAAEVVALLHSYPNSTVAEDLAESVGVELNEAGEVCYQVTWQLIKEFEKLANKLFRAFRIHFDFTPHFHERMGDSRNKPCVSMRELGNIFQKLYGKQKADGKTLAGDKRDVEAIVKDSQRDLNLPVAIEYNRRSDSWRVAVKTIQRKVGFVPKSGDKIIEVS